MSSCLNSSVQARFQTCCPSLRDVDSLHGIPLHIQSLCRDYYYCHPRKKLLLEDSCPSWVCAPYSSSLHELCNHVGHLLIDFRGEHGVRYMVDFRGGDRGGDGLRYMVDFHGGDGLRYMVDFRCGDGVRYVVDFRCGDGVRYVVDGCWEAQLEGFEAPTIEQDRRMVFGIHGYRSGSANFEDARLQRHSAFDIRSHDDE